MSTSPGRLVHSGREPVVPPAPELEQRLTRLLVALGEASLDGLLVYAWAWRCENARYLTGSAGLERPAMLHLRPDRSVSALATSRLDHAALLATGRVDDVVYEPAVTAGGVARLLAQTPSAARLGVTHLEFLPLGIREMLAEARPGIHVVDATRTVDLVRMVKSPWEHARVAYSAAVASRAWEAMLAALVPGAAEFEVVAAAERQLKREGAEDNFMIIAFGRTEVRSMHPPENRTISAGDLVRTELSPQVDGYYAQVCRTAVLGEASAAQARAYEAFREATEAGIAKVRPGVTSHDVAKAENDVLRRHGFGEFCTPQHTRVRGHGLGLHLDELAGLQEGDETVIPEGATLIVHPNTYAAEAGYMVVGDPLVVTDTGTRRLAEAPTTLPSVAVSPK